MITKRQLVVTGAGGFVAGSVLKQAGVDWQIHAVSRSPRSSPPGGVRWHVCDPLEPGQLAQLFQEVRPDAVIHTAALADIDLCQVQPALARTVNVEYVRSLVALCEDAGARLVFCSTDNVFDGEHAPYSENDAPNPVNFYGETKAEAEQFVGRLGIRGVTARLSLVVGLPVLGAGNSFLARMIAAFKEGRPVCATVHEVRTPVDVITAGRALLEVAAGDHHGIFHLAGLSRVNRLDLARTIARRFGFPTDLAMGQSAVSGRAPRPRDVSLDNRQTCARLKTPMRTLEEGLSLVQETVRMTSL